MALRSLRRGFRQQAALARRARAARRRRQQAWRAWQLHEREERIAYRMALAAWERRQKKMK